LAFPGFRPVARRRFTVALPGGRPQPNTAAGLLCSTANSRFGGPGWVVCHEVPPVQTAMRNCTRDEGRSFEAGSQVLASNRCKLLSSRAMVVSVAVNVGRISRRVRLREASASEPPMNCRKRIRRCQNRGVTLPPGSVRENPEACPSGIRHVGGAKLNQALVRNVRTCAPMQRERSQAAQTARIRVPMRGTGAEQPVVGTKTL
jgi:hypothetical protein